MAQNNNEFFLGGIMGFWGGIGALATLGSGLFGGKSKGATPKQATSQSGFAAIPKQVQDAYLNQYLPQVLAYNKAGPNQFTQQAMQGYGGGIQGIIDSLGQYKSVFDQNTTQPTLDEIQRQADIQKNQLNARAAGSGLGGLLNSNTAIQLGELQNNTDRLKSQYTADFNRENTLNALNLRSQTLSELMRAGDQQYDQLSKLANLLSPFLNGSTSKEVGEKAATPNVWDKVAGSVVAAPRIFNQFGF